MGTHSSGAQIPPFLFLLLFAMGPLFKERILLLKAKILFFECNIKWNKLGKHCAFSQYLNFVQFNYLFGKCLNVAKSKMTNAIFCLI